jgi:hypothetical protein
MYSGRDRALHSGRLDARRRKAGREIRYGGGGPASRGIRFDRHCSGPNLDAMPKDIIRRIERYSGVKLAEVFAIPISRSSGTANMPARMPFTSRRLSWSTG